MIQASKEAEDRLSYSYRHDRSVPPFPDDRPIIIFDGHCVLCSRFAQFIIEHDQHKTFRLMAAQSPLGQALYRHFKLDPVKFETNVLLESRRGWFKSDGSIRIFARLGFPWSMVRVLRCVPQLLLDRLYGLVARNRLQWFGSSATCFMPDPADRDRFLG